MAKKRKNDRNDQRPHLVNDLSYIDEFGREIVSEENEWIEKNSTPQHRDLARKIINVKKKRIKGFHKGRKFKRSSNKQFSSTKATHRRKQFIERDKIEGLGIIVAKTSQENERKQVGGILLERKAKIREFDIPNKGE